MDGNEHQEFERLALEIVDQAQKQGLHLRLLGAVAFRIHCPGHATMQESMNRVLTDLDFAGYFKEDRAVEKFFTNGLGFATQQAALTPGLFVGRKIYHDPTGQRPHVDIFFDKLDMCHVVSWEGRLDIDTPTICLADLMLEKLQIVRLNEKDVKDMIMLLLEHEVGGSDKEIVNGKYMAKTFGKDWGFYYTATTNLKKVKDSLGRYAVLTDDDRRVVSSRVDQLLDMIEKEPKSMGWKFRAKIGTKTKWYNDVEEVERADHLMDE